MRWALFIWLTLSAAGAAIIALPDAGPRLVSLSESHGPSARDAAGVLIVILGWCVYLVALWRQRQKLASRMRSRYQVGGAFALGLGAGLVTASVASDYAYWWVVGVADLLAVQLLLAYLVSSGSRESERDDG